MTRYGVSRERGYDEVYWKQERVSGFGFSVVTDKGIGYVVFDEKFVLDGCTIAKVDKPNCASIKLKK